MKRELVILIMAGMFVACGVAAFWIPDANDNLEPLDNTWGLRIPSLASCNTFNSDADGIFSCGTAGANTALSNLASVAINTSLVSDTDSTDDLGSSGAYWANAYVDKIYLNSTATLDGAVAGLVNLTGNLTISGNLVAVLATTTAVTTTDFGCTDCLNATEIEDIYLLNTGDTGTGNYTLDTPTFHLDSSNNRVGIGTTTPEYTLDVVGQAKIDATTTIRARLIVDDGSSNTTTTLQLGSTTTQNVACLKVRTFDNTGWTYFVSLTPGADWTTTTAASCE